MYLSSRDSVCFKYAQSHVSPTDTRVKYEYIRIKIKYMRFQDLNTVFDRNKHDSFSTQNSIFTIMSFDYLRRERPVSRLTCLIVSSARSCAAALPAASRAASVERSASSERMRSRTGPIAVSTAVAHQSLRPIVSRPRRAHSATSSSGVSGPLVEAVGTGGEKAQMRSIRFAIPGRLAGS